MFPAGFSDPGSNVFGDSRKVIFIFFRSILTRECSRPTQAGLNFCVAYREKVGEIDGIDDTLEHA